MHELKGYYTKHTKSLTKTSILYFHQYVATRMYSDIGKLYSYRQIFFSYSVSYFLSSSHTAIYNVQLHKKADMINSYQSAYSYVYVVSMKSCKWTL